MTPFRKYEQIPLTLEKSRRYRCPQCKKIVFRRSNKAWIKSHCEATGKDTRLILQEHVS